MTSRQAFGASTTDVLQSEVLLGRIIRPNTTCEYGRKHSFASLASVSDFQKAIPVRPYEAFRPAIERMTRGEQGVLVSEPVRRFFITSGSTSKPKYVPVTSSFVRDKWRAFQRYWNGVRHDHPLISRGVLIANFSDGSKEQKTEGGFLCTSESSFWNAWSGSEVQTHHPLLRKVLDISDQDARYYTIARILLETNVSALMALNPSTILRLFESIRKYGGELLCDIERGGLWHEMNVESGVREYVSRLFKSNARRANELKPVLNNQHTIQAKRLWPNLQLCICWRSPMVVPYLDLLAPYLDGVPQRDYLTMASEGVIAVPFEDDISGGVLATDIHFYEFIPEELVENADPPTLLAHELEVGRKYVVILTTSAGLYRYNIGDVVLVTGFLNTMPVLSFKYRAGSTCSLTGEKLTEDQVAHAIRDTCSRMSIHLQSFTLCPVPRPFPHYALAAEFAAPAERSLLQNFVSEVDRELGILNVEYRAKRASRRLGSPELLVLSPGTFGRVRQQRTDAGVSDSQIKIACLTRDPNWHMQLTVVEQVPCASAT